MFIRRLTPADAAAYQKLRLAALQTFPSAFSSSYQEECQTPLSTIKGHLDESSGRNMFGAFFEGELIGMVGVGRETPEKIKHKGFIRGLYVDAAYQGRGVGKMLMKHAVAFAATLNGVRHITLAVTAGNEPAIALYEKMEFTIFGREPGALFVEGALHDELQMMLRVGDK